ncbi:unnamed protein product [Pleuronectes platessa]|uniref:Uncharacterized protein n=1 Tax=Pleuronectes platessa TaxID=8262 RepID=A0A9N7UQ12_PLEPL|nr:unnamed protein product [Pleuronectes platessa]
MTSSTGDSKKHLSCLLGLRACCPEKSRDHSERRLQRTSSSVIIGFTVSEAEEQTRVRTTDFYLFSDTNTGRPRQQRAAGACRDSDALKEQKESESQCRSLCSTGLIVDVFHKAAPRASSSSESASTTVFPPISSASHSPRISLLAGLQGEAILKALILFFLLSPLRFLLIAPSLLCSSSSLPLSSVPPLLSLSPLFLLIPPSLLCSPSSLPLSSDPPLLSLSPLFLLIAPSLLCSPSSLPLSSVPPHPSLSPLFPLIPPSLL